MFEALHGGPLDDDKYVLVQFHFHWGSDSSRGSEHKIDGVAYAAEVAFAHHCKQSSFMFSAAIIILKVTRNTS